MMLEMPSAKASLLGILGARKKVRVDLAPFNLASYPRSPIKFSAQIPVTFSTWSCSRGTRTLTEMLHSEVDLEENRASFSVYDGNQRPRPISAHWHSYFC